ncbi:MAG: zf-TFIIB domain-containing protein [Solirubrobacterales bacterium]|nr:zf-TFIIB domain-containing protein [Solirubrobacterales bacterium]
MNDATGLQCPNCATTMLEVDRSGVSIDACPTCRGVWLDRGELDKILALESQAAGDDDFLSEVQGKREDHSGRGGGRESGSHGGKQSGKRRKRGMLEDLFDFG